MNRLFGTLPIATALALTPVGMAQTSDAQPIATRPAVDTYFNAALEYWKIWDTTDATLVNIIADASAAAMAEEGSEAHKALIKLQPEIQSIIRASQMPLCDWQIDYTKGFDTLLPHLGKMRGSSQLLRADAQRLIGGGDIEGATTRAVASMNLASQISDGNFLIGSLVGMAIANLSCEMMNGVLDSDQSTQADRDLLLAAFNQIDDDNLFGVTEAIALERDIAIKWLEEEFTGDGARDVADLMPYLSGEAAEEDHPLTKFSDEDIVEDLAMLSSAYDALLEAWYAEDSEARFADINTAVVEGEFGELAKVILPALANVRRSTDRIGASIETTKARIADTKDQDTGSDK